MTGSWWRRALFTLAAPVLALLWAFLDTSRLILDFNGISKDIVTIMQGIAVLSVVIAYELVRRYRLAQQQREVGRQLGTAEPQPAGAAA